MNLNDTSDENIKKVTALWSKSVNLITQRQSRSDSGTLKNNRLKAHDVLKDIDLWIYIWDNNWSHEVEKITKDTIASWDMHELIVPFAKHLIEKLDQEDNARPLMKPVQMETLLRGLLNGYRAKRSAKGLELFLRTDKECGADEFVNSRLMALLDVGQPQMAIELISKNISTENQWKLMYTVFQNGAQWKNVVKSVKKMKKMGWDLNNMPSKDNTIGHILRTNRVFYASKEECQDLIKMGVRPINLQVPCSPQFTEAFAEFENSLISDKIEQGSKIKTTRTKKM